MITIKLFLIISFIQINFAEENVPGNITDVNICKVSHMGLEYYGTISKTESGIRCQSWATNAPVHKIDEAITDDKFPEHSKKLAKNYCRNPDRKPKGPWCYSMALDLIDDTCGIPLCVFTECKITGPGMEYAGTHNFGVSGKKCLKWNKARNKVKSKSDYIKMDKFPKHTFPDESLAGAKKYCRNPSGDIGGPWCFVEIEEGGVEAEYCDIPFCDDQDCMVFTKSFPTYSHYTNFDKTLSNFTFGVKIWDSDKYLNVGARLLLSTLALPVTGQLVEQLGIGIEISISNTKSALTFGNVEKKPDFEPTAGILKSTEYTFFMLTWHSGFITLNQVGVTKPIFLAEYKTKKNLLGFKKNQFVYYSAMGENVLWSFPFCDDLGECDVHTTTTNNYQQFWPLRDTKIGHDLHFFLRGTHSAQILLIPTPTIRNPHINILLQHDDHFTRISMVEYDNGPKVLLKEIKLPSLLDYWIWHEFSISIFADSMHFHWTKHGGTHLIMELEHDLFKKMRWFSVSSENSVAHWTFYCTPPTHLSPPAALLPECSLNIDEVDYKGTQGVTSEGLPCAPWSGKDISSGNVRESFPGKSIFEANNYCRDPLGENKGTFCYAILQKPTPTIEKQYCHIRKCKSAECRMAGTGNDYIGKVNVTRSNRTCQRWTEKKKSTTNNTDTTVIERIYKKTINDKDDLKLQNFDDKEPAINIRDAPESLDKLVHPVNPEYLNPSLFADMLLDNIDNFCRNPSRNIAGSWCYTTDDKIPQDLCNVRDCDQPEECTIIVKGQGKGRDIYILPQWKEHGIHGGMHFSLKQWNPDLLDGIIFEMRPSQGEDTMRLVMGADDNTKIRFYYKSQLMKEKTMVHLIPAGKWASFWLQIRHGEILLGYKGVPNALFEWTHDKVSSAFEPMFMTYMSINGNPIGIYFQCDECHTEHTTAKTFDRVMPIGLWSEEEQPVYRKFNINLRGNGTAVIPLMNLPETENQYVITMSNADNKIVFSRVVQHEIATLTSVELDDVIMTTKSWTTYTFMFAETQFEVFKNSKSVLKHFSTVPMLFYWFSLGVIDGWISWAANCEPLDIDGPPRDGGWSRWSKWQCTVSCGGGDGYRTRTCSNPRPNIFGRLCDGETQTTGRCNDFECGDLSPDTMETIQEHLQTQKHSLMVNEGESVVLKNDHEILKIISAESPDAYYEWTLNGLFVNPEPHRIEFQYDDIIIHKVEVEDMGVYVCMLHRINEKRLILRVISLAVVTKHYAISTRATLSITLVSNAVTLGYIYSDLSQKWLLNGTVYLDYGVTTLAAVSAEYLKPLNMSHTGEWKCVVEQSDLHLAWITNLVKVQVKSAPNVYTHLMEDHLTAPLFAWLKTERRVRIFLVFIVIFICALVFGCLKAYLKWGTLPQLKPRKKYKKNRRK